MPEEPPNTKYVTIRKEVPRERNEYEITDHYRDQLRDRVPATLRDRVLNECLERGVIRGKDDVEGAEKRDVKQFFEFIAEVGGHEWAVVVGIREKAFEHGFEKHRIITVSEIDFALRIAFCNRLPPRNNFCPGGTLRSCECEGTTATDGYSLETDGRRRFT